MQRQNIADIYPLSSLQQGMLFHTLLLEDSGVYIMQDRYRIRGRIDAAAFERAWQTLVDTHPALRTAFSWKSQNQPLQIVYKQVKTPLTLIDLRDRDTEAQESYIEDLLQREQQSGFNMARPPLIRFRLVRRGEEDYELVRSFHHILMDAWCISLILAEFLKVYDALLKGETPTLTPPRPFRDYIDWLQRQDSAAARAFWQERLAGLSSSTPLPVEREAHKNQYSAAVRVEDTSLRLPKTETRKLHEFCRRHDLTPNTFFQGVWALLLSRYSGQTDVLFGITVSGRPPSLAGVEHMVGLFINSQPLRIKLPEKTTAIEWLGEIQRDNLAMREYEHTSLVDIQGWSDFPRGETLFDTLLVYENAPFDRLILEGEFSFQWQGMQHGVHTHYGLTVVIMPAAELEMKISYDCARFDRATVDAMLRHMRELALAMIATPVASLDDLNLLSKDEQQQLLHDFNRSHHDFPLEHGYPVLFEQQVARHGKRTVASYQGQSLSFIELDRRSNRLAHAIAGLVGNTGPEFLIALLGERDLSLLTAIIATFKAGGAYMPLAPNLPEGRIKELLSLSQAPVLVASEACRNRARALAAQLGCQLLIAEDYWLDGEASALPAVSSPERLAYVLFTSGSTGTPKGVMVEHKGMLNNIFGKQPQDTSLGLSKKDVIAQTASQAFDISVWQFLAAPVVGARVEILPDAIAHDPRALLNAIFGHGITLLEAVPTMIRGLLDVASPQQNPGKLRWLIATGEALPPALANEWLERFPHIPIMNAYGPAECSDDVSFHALREPGLNLARPLPIGKPTANNQLYILDDHLRPQPVGVPGEIHVGGVGVGRGYWQDEARTRQAFIDHPFKAGERFYRSGDLGRWLPDGTIEYLGRRDFQVKIRGHRIELGEIENRLEALPQVRAAVVVAPRDLRGDRRLVAYWTASDEAGDSVDQTALSRALAAQLPEYMVPTLLIRLDTLPLSSNGKVDRKTLEAREVTLASTKEVAPRNDTEARLAEIWKEVLQREEVSVEDSFFALGGHSLLATRIMARIRESFRRELPLRALFEQNTIAKLAALLDDKEDDVQGSLPALKKQPRPDRLPLSFAQQRLWFLDQLEPGSAQYNTGFALRFKGPLDVKDFTAALDTLVARHPILRSRIHSEDDTPWLVIDEQQRADLQVVQVPAREWSTLAGHTLADEIGRPFALDSQPPIRSYLYQHAERDEAIFLCVQHHSVIDGWSIYNLLTELAEIRLAQRENRRPLLPELSIDYVDYSLWQRRRELEAHFDQQLAYWERTLGQDPYVLELPTDHPRRHDQGEMDYRSQDVRLTLDRGLTDAIRAYSARQGVTPFVVMMASLHLLLGRYCAQQQVRVGTPVAGRGQPETHPLVGCFVNTLVIQSELVPSLSFDDLVKQLQSTIIEAQAHQDAPFERVVETLSHSRDLSLSPLFQVLFTMHQHRLGQLDWGDNQVEEVVVENRTSPFDLCADVIDDESDLSLLFSYRSVLFEHDTARRWLGHWVNLLEAVMADPVRGLYHYPLLSEAERHRQMVEWNRTEKDFQAPDTLTAMLEAQCARSPQAIAVEAGSFSLTYDQLHRRANRLAHWLMEQLAELPPPAEGPMVGICLERSVDMVVAALAVLKAGAAYLPLAPDLPGQRLQYILDDAEVPLVLTHSTLKAVCPSAARVLELDRWQPASSIPETPPEAPHDGENLAYVLYTSGSTGQPKGVLNRHQGIVNRLSWIQSLFRLSGEDAILHKAPIMFDFSVSEIFWALTSGAHLVVAKPDGHLDSDYLIDLIIDKGVTTLDLVPTMLGSLLDTGRLAECKRLRCVLSGGEALSAELVRRFHQTLDLELHNLYGPTENAIDASFYRCPREAIPANLPIGKPLPNTELYILDEYQNPVPVGVPGELYIGGVQLARGYLKRPDLTRASFIPSPFAAGKRLYRTGDRCRYLTDGNVEYLGRLDHQIKLRGQRIELGEIDACLEAQPGVSESLTLLRDEDPQAAQLVSYWVAAADPEGAQPPTEAQLRERLSQALPAYMVPARFLRLDHLPLTRNGKIDRKALLAMAPAPETRESLPPRTDTERRLAAIWQEVLQHDSIGVEDNFFALGGHSLLITRLMARVRATFDVALPLRTLFDYPTVAAMAERVDRAGRQQTERLANIHRPERLPLSYAQQRLWFLSQLEPDSSQYNMPFAIRFIGELDKTALIQAFDDLVARHDILRGRVLTTDSEPELIIASEAPSLFMEGIAGQRWESALSGTVEQESRQPFDLASDAPIRARLLYLADQAGTAVLLLTLHHSVADDWSISILLKELAAAYRARQQQQPPSLPPLTAQYVDYSLWQRRPEQLERDEQELAYWKRTLGEGDYRLVLPADTTARASHDGRCDYCEVILTDSQYRQVQEYARQQGITPFIVHMAVLHLLLHRYGGQQDIRVGMPVAGRHHPDTHGMIGCFVNTLVIRSQVCGDAGLSFAGLVRHIGQSVIEAQEHQDVPFERVVEQLVKERDLHRSPLFQVMLSMEHTQLEQDDWPGLTLEELAVPAIDAQFDLSFDLNDSGHAMVLRASYRSSQFSQARIQRLLKHWLYLLDQGLGAPDRPIADFNLVTPEEQQEIRGFNHSVHEFPLHLSFAELFDRQVATHPEKVVASCAGQTLSFAQLAQRGRALARAFIAAGLFADDTPLVALLGERGLPFLSALVATLNSGGAYLPLDPNLPDARLAELLTQGRPALLVTTAACRERAAALAAAQRYPLVVIEEHWLSADTATPARRGVPESLAYVLFTSGSTGVPKGVMVEQRGMLNNLFGKQPTLGLGENDVIAQTASQAFDISVWQLLAAPVTGARVEILPDCIAHDPERLLIAIDRHGLTLLEAVPAVIRGLLDAAADAATTLASLRWLLPTGEALPASLANDWLMRFPDIPMMNAYGPAECADDVAFHPIRSTLDPALPVPIGRPTANNELLILDDAGRLLPPGITGEIGIGGAGVGCGYWHDEARTRESFVEHPLTPGARFYRSGDLGRWREDGTIEYLGRKDFQVKVRGHRIELGEIESHLEQHPQVKAAAVVAPENRLGERQLVGYWVARDGSESAPDLSQWLAAQLPAYMVPSLLQKLPEMPLNPNGKIDRRALTDRPLKEAQAQHRAPTTQTEILLAGLWQQILDKPGERQAAGDIDVNDNFFALGGHSLLITRLLALIREYFGVNLPLRSLFEQPTLAALAALIDEAASTSREDAQAMPLGQLPWPEDLPLSFEQRRLWLLDQMDPGSNQYHVPFALKLSGQLDVVALKQALEQLAQRHDILRSRIRVKNETPYLSIDGDAPRLEVNILADDDWDDSVRAALQAQACNPFDLAREALLRARLLQRKGRQEAVLMITQHHVIADDWSVQILLDELGEFYAAAREQRASALPALPLQYVDYTLWQQAPEQQHDFAAQLDYWRDTLGEEPYVLNLPTDHPPAAKETSLAAGEHQLSLPAPMTKVLRQYAARQSSTVFVVLMAALHVLLARYCNQPEVRVGTPVAGRRQLKTQSLLGCFVNTLVIDSQVDNASNFNQLVAQMRQRILAAQEHQDVPFERVVDALVKDRDYDRSPLFQVMLSMENTRLDSSRWPGLTLTEIDMPATAPQFAQSWEVYDDGESLTVKLSYDRNQFEEDSMARWLRHWQQLLETVLSAPGHPLAQLDWLNKAERCQLLVDFNQSQQDFALDQSYAEHFARHVQRHGESPLAHCGSDSLSYRELDRRSGRLAHALLEAMQSQGSETLVALLGERDLGLLTAMVAIFKAGAAYMPLDPSLPSARLGELLALSGTSLVLASRACRDRAQMLANDQGCQLLIIEDHWQQGGYSAPAVISTADQLAYVLFTSGSTGTPKGVMVEQRGMLNNIFGKQPTLGLGEGDVIAQTASQSFDISVWQFLAAPVVGAQVRILLDEIAHDPERLLRAIDEAGITLLEAVPAIIQGLLDSAEQSDTTLPSLRWLIPTGEALPPALANRWLKRFPSIPLMNAYGPAECSDDVAFHAIVDGELDTRRPVPVGHPTANNQLYILDTSLRPQPVGIPGEICIAGVGVGRGYWRDEERTRQAFIEHPFTPGERFYRSGDLGRWLPDGTIEYLGRRDFQVKVRGHRIEPGEIENRLIALPEVKTAVVTAPANERGVCQLVAYWVADADRVDADLLRDRLKEQLPGYMVPDLFVELDALPLNANGKVDRKALPRPETRARELVAAAEGNEALLCELVRTLLGLNAVWANDNFFALGGDSILALQLVSRARQQGITLTPRLIFQQRSIRDLARAAGALDHIDAEQGPLGGDVPLMPVQCWFFDQNFEQRNYWNQALLCQYRTPLDATVTEQVLHDLVQHHDALRLRFEPTPEGWRQHYGDVDGAFRFTVIKDISADRLDETLSSLAEGLDTQRGPISQAALLNLPDGQQQLYWVIHHLVVDTVSWHLLQDDFATLYAQRANGEPARLPPKTSSYRQWADYWRAPATLARLAQQQAWWQQQDIDFPLPVAHPEAPHRIADAETLTATLDRQRTEQFLKQAQSAYRTRPEDMLLTALAITLSRWSGQRSVRLDLEHHGRTGGSERLDISRTVGWFAAIYPLKLDVSQPDEPGQVLCAVKEQLRAVPDHGVGYGALRYLADSDRALPGRHRSPVSFEYFGVSQRDEDDGPLRALSDPQPLERGAGNHCEYELDVTAQIVDGRLCLEWTYGHLRDARQTQQHHLNHFVDTLEALVDHCLSAEAGQLTPSDFPMAKGMDQKTLNTLLKRFGAAAQDETRKES